MSFSFTYFILSSLATCSVKRLYMYGKLVILTSFHLFFLHCCFCHRYQKPLVLNSSFLPAKCFLNHKATKTKLLPQCSVHVGLCVSNFFFFFAGSVNFLVADGLKFSHPLHHLGKGPEVNRDLQNSDIDHHLILPLLPITCLVHSY